MKRIILLISFLTLIFISWFVMGYLKLFQTSSVPSAAPAIIQAQKLTPATEIKPQGYQLQVVATGLYVPWSLVFTDNNRLLVTERSGAIRQIKDGILAKTPLITFPEASQISEEGLLGLEKDPQYQQNHFLYTILTYQKNKTTLLNKVLRLIDQGDKITVDKILLDGIPAAKYHAGGRIKFGPDGKLYLTTGDAQNGPIAQDKNSLGGKILRLNSDGSIPSDNPFNSPVYSLGHRNPQGLAWYPPTNQLFITEHGPSGTDGPGGGDEINLIVKGGNYGWPLVHHDQSKPGLISPLIQFTPAEAPAAALFYQGNLFPEFSNNFLFAALKGEGIIRIILDPTDPSKIISYQKLPFVAVGRIRDLIEGPEGAIYFTTSNRDGRGTVRKGDDKIYKIVPSN